ncbi:heterokaryon incompatibility protein-domain-containing protein [Hypoxylon argillaceum]|nr:heterokaryon incompatibility protein-domain-containing protein [Hypoxylon argillaceum]
MRLLHVNSYEIREFVEGNVPDYAILSHTWGEQEVTYKDMKKGNADKLKGYQKILGCCDQSRLDGFEYVWIDTCCIDKRSSSELSEAINSMYRWYQEARVCYAYLEDVYNVDQDDANHTKLKSSRWFTRGWTLQELIAPQIVWASKRKATRIEDEAYCLLGLFGVSMPLIYGEGSKAFRRLQEEIMKQSDDETIFAIFERPRPPIYPTLDNAVVISVTALLLL